MSGQSPELCCTSTSPAWRASTAPGMRSPGACGHRGHAVTGVRDLTGAEKRAGVGYVYLHCVIDDHSRYAYVEQHRDQGGDTAAAVLSRAIDHFASLGMKAPEAVMSDNAFAYRRSNAFRVVLTAHSARHILTPPYTPRWNGKASAP
jgi:Integrase core domain